ncbi:MAG: TetR family transcriptional regulator [Pseudomonadales bacterium]|nr:TetR/AcrR family transcriptional regulator [Pseudomonadales bacterium]NIX06800.1 TetR family transcriptional regulator [Pseudomonadales bacterium]
MPQASRSLRADSAATRESILDASIKLFSERGYRNTSLRAIADAADVNLAAANYHFGSKAQLLEAAFERCISPINDERMRRLRQLQQSSSPPSVEAIVRAFVDLEFALDGNEHLDQFLAHLFAEPKSVSVPLLEKTFAPIVQAYFTVLSAALPQIPLEELRWRFHFMIGSMIQLARFRHPLNVFAVNESSGQATVGAGIDQLVRFAVAGLTQPAAAGSVS